ncbi:protein PLASTID MOVEMENT IMPAIRED 2 isoform X2 [Iris pallida]|uniref:Protein PLASTID MOVEMENT IMPAIRED 2 isoform X2 n=1 Tax=Iris pallida TaxID=29817 RepID=A0AAX6DYY1_IRIPA|nr:protein PLASTID MOVEMENT IMPAIRED 2 isoform X2 [Iris pallida]
MDRSTGESLEGIRSVKAAISLYGQKFNGKNQKELPTKSGELHLAQLGIQRLNETKNSAEREKAFAESELLKAKSMVKELSAEIESTNAKAMARKLELQSSTELQTDGQEDSDLMQELSDMKQKLSRLKLDFVSVSESKAKAEKEIEDSNSRVRSCMTTIEEISKEIEKANEEHALVELARIEAEREFREIEAQRKAEASKFSKEIEEAKEKLKVLQDEVRQAKDLETKAAVTNADLSVLQSEMELVRAMERNFENNRIAEEAELKAAKQELETIKEEGFQYMSSMDVIRDELILISKETNLLKKQERKADSTIQLLNSKLLKAKSKFELASRAEERTKAIVSNLSLALNELQLETETAKKEKQVITEKTTKTKLKIELTESKILSTEEKLQAAVQELAAAKTSEAIALKKMKEVAERTMKNRAAALSTKPSTITISKTEYEYLTNCAASAQVVADKKVAASQAWIEALKAEEQEILTRRAIIEKKIKELRVSEEEEELPEMEEPLIDQSTIENDTRNADEDDWLNLERQVRTPRKSMKENRASVATRRKSNTRRSSVSHAARYHARSPSFAIKKKTAIMPNLVKFLSKRSTITQK